MNDTEQFVTWLVLAAIAVVIWKVIPLQVKGAIILCVSLMAAAGLYGIALANGYGTETGVRAHPKTTQLAKKDIPARHLKLYAKAEREQGVSRHVLAGIGKVESNHGRSSAPGVRSGVNRFGCCAGHMQFNLRNGPPSTWDTYGKGGNVYDPADSIPAAARLLKANGYGDSRMRPGYRRCPGINARPGSVNAIRHYNNACWYVRDVLAWSERYRTGRFS